MGEPDQLADDAYSCCPFLMGSLAGPAKQPNAI